MLEEEAMKNNKPLTVYLPVRLATYLLNDKRELIQGIETRQKVKIKVVPDNTIEGANYHIDRDNRTSDEFKASLNKQNDKNTKTLNETSSRYEEAIVSAVTPKSLPPKPIMSKKNIKKRKESIIKKLLEKIKSIFGIKPKKIYRGRSYNNRRKYNKNGYNKYNNKYKSFNRKKGYQGKNINNKKAVNNNQNKLNTSD
jgi:ribonuclease E